MTNVEKLVLALVTKFWSLVEKGDGCWLWQGELDDDGYGRFDVRGCRGGLHRRVGAHRAAWVATCGAIPKGKLVLHHCDVRACVRPDHLFIGTHADNVADRVKKNRSARGTHNGVHTKPECRAYGDKNGLRRHPERVARGERQHLAKLTDAKVRKLRVTYAAGGVSQRALAVQYGVSQATISLVLKGRTWGHAALD